MSPTTPAWAVPLSLTLSPAQLSLLLTVLGLLVIAGLVAGILHWRGTRKAAGKDWTVSALDGFALLLSPVWIVLLVFVLYALWRVFDAFDPALTGSNLRWHVLALVGLITALGALVTAPLALIRVYTTERQTRVAEQGHMTDRISKAVDQLGAEKTVKRPGPVVDGKASTVEETLPNIEVRIGGIYALERIAQDSMATDKGRDHIRVMELLCAYIRENAPASMSQVFPKPRTDIQTALTVIGRRSPEQIALERKTTSPDQTQGYRLNLRATCLQLADLAYLIFENAQFDGAHLESANFTRAQVQGANFQGAQLQGANFVQAQMQKANFSAANLQWTSFIKVQLKGADLRRANMECAILVNAQIEEANFGEANLQKTDLWGWSVVRSSLRSVDFTGARNLDRTAIDAAWGDQSTILPQGINRPDHWDTEKLGTHDLLP